MSLNDVPGEPIWIELFTSDTEAATRFYGGLFGWTARGSGEEFGGYITFGRDGAPIAGCMKNDGTGVDGWNVYLESNNAADTVEMAKANGGQVLLEAMPVGDLGHMAMVTDPAGAAVGIWQPHSMTGISTRAGEGAPGWFEVLSSDYDAVIPFYENVFGWDTHTMADTPGFRYTTLGRDEDALAGIMDASGFLGDRPSHWHFFIVVGDTEAAVARASELGGTQVTAPEETPYGRAATLADPSGVELLVMGPNPA
ncbi:MULTISPECIES: VOC family protein [unclassified Nocardioides]|uniref:VOC family protein n=1 Tax=unclassified Nocardioides TaxID=2615069 RepID=UPI0009F134EA|nr:MULTISPECIES: VOC family protein [unclassified Nocardioides]GAW51135.1 Glyoxalase/bleomycin resistance protein/dioxygenase [Nocardioides sp. PD653-B2]GAW56990.1 Glyoxalase/bleomycin resistance protein/dioxygen ase [Nocardioides sp. PD653]